PRRMLARGAAAEVAAAHEHLRAPRLRPLQNEVGLLLAFGVVAPIGEQMPSQPLARGGGEEPRGDDLIRVDVVVRQHDGPRPDLLDRLHGAHLRNSRGSATAPLTADAAAVSGLARIVRAPVPWR